MRQIPTGRGLRILCSRFESAANRELSTLGLTAAQAQLLIILNNSEDTLMPQKRLEAELGASQASATGIISRLAAKGLVEQTRDGLDRRARLITITEKGIDCCKEASDALEKARREVFSNLADDELSQLVLFMKKLGFEDI